MTTMSVAVNLLWLAPRRVGGSEEYLVRQLAGLPIDPELSPVLFCQHGFAEAHLDLAKRFEVATMPFRRDLRGSRVVAEHTWLSARTRRFDVVHHGGGTVPVATPGRVLLTIHDLQYRQFPDYFSSARLRYLSAMVPRSVRRAAGVATPSEFVRGTVIEAFGADPSQVVVVPHGIPKIEIPDPSVVTATLHRYGLDGRPYVIYPAITHRHKGHTVLVEMMRHVDPELVLVLIGGVGSAEKSVGVAIDRAGMGRRVIRPGRVSSSDRNALIAGAQALVFPSEFEGFGAPLVEAMALDVPVVCSDHAAVREVVGDAAVIVHGGPAEWASAVDRAQRERSDLIGAGRLRRRAFTLEVSGNALADAYRRVIDRNRGS